LYIADTFNNRIRKVGTNGIITTIAGKNISGFSGDGGEATNAALGTPYSVSVDHYGYVYIADYFNNRIRRVDPSGIITTVAGNGTTNSFNSGVAPTNASLASPSSVFVDAGGDLLVADDAIDYHVWKIALGRNPTLTLKGVTTN